MIMHEKKLKLYCALDPLRVVEFYPLIGEYNGKTIVRPVNVCDQSPGTDRRCQECAAAVTLYAYHHPDFWFLEPVYLSDIQEDMRSNQS